MVILMPRDHEKTRSKVNSTAVANSSGKSGIAYPAVQHPFQLLQTNNISKDKAETGRFVPKQNTGELPVQQMPVFQLSAARQVIQRVKFKSSKATVDLSNDEIVGYLNKW